MLNFSLYPAKERWTISMLNIKNFMFKNKFTLMDLSLENTIFYKGVAILMIVMHNFFHLIPPKFGENEQDFKLERIEAYFHIVFSQPELSFQATLSLLGHYGVQVFLFLSAYGLTKKYINSKIFYIDFLKKRILKIYPAFLLSIVLWAIYTGIMVHNSSPIQMIIDNWKSLLVKLVFISNFIPGQLYALNGPWWFVSLIVQFYIIFPFMLYIYKKYNNVGLIGLSLVGLLLTAYIQPLVSIPVPGTILTHLPELSIGIFLANNKNFSLNYLTILLIVIVFILSNYYYTFWFLSYSSALILLLIMIQNIIQKSNKILTKYMLFTGSISMYIFYINGFMRAPWKYYAKNLDSWYINILACLIFISAVTVTAWLMMRFYDIIKQRILTNV